jgi:hypothetical protein
MPRPREALAVLGIPGLQAASPSGLSEFSPPPALGSTLHRLRLRVASAVHDRVWGSQTGKSDDFRDSGRGVAATACSPISEPSILANAPPWSAPARRSGPT